MSVTTSGSTQELCWCIGRHRPSVSRISPPIFGSRRAFAVLSRQNVAEILHALAAAMTDSGVGWYLFGAQAAIIWGSPRLSADIDATVAIRSGRLADFIAAMTAGGFDLVFADSDFVERTRVIPFVHRASGMPLDIVLSGPGLEEEFLRRAVTVDVEGTRVPVISPEDLIITKILAGRPKDLEDVRGVIHERRTTLDQERIRTVLGLLQQALGQGDLLPPFDKAWTEGALSEIRLKKSSPKSKKR